jgi:hypothetical protein
MCHLTLFATHIQRLAGITTTDKVQIDRGSNPNGKLLLTVAREDEDEFDILARPLLHD